MTIPQGVTRGTTVILGLNSGTSADGLDLAALKFSGSSSSPLKFLAGVCQPYPAGLKQCILDVSHSTILRLETLIYLDNALGRFYGEAAQRFMRKLKKNGISVDAVASHGQTVRHLPRPTKFLGQSVHGTLQIGSLEQIAARTGTVVVGDFRQADVALGHEGAPITISAMARLFGHQRKSRLILNIGGMANYFYFPARSQESAIRAADTGPGNSLSDLLCQKLWGKPYDRSGLIAASGRVSNALLDIILKEPFYKGRCRSTGRETFGEAMADKLLAAGRRLKISHADIVRSAVEGTVYGITHALEPILKADRSIDKLYLTGGGVHNSFLSRQLRDKLAPLEVCSIAELGFDPDLVEASAYAVMGWTCLRSMPLPTVFDRKDNQRLMPVLGKIVQPPVQQG